SIGSGRNAVNERQAKASFRSAKSLGVYRQLNSARGPAATPREGTGKAAEGGLNGGRHSRERDWSRVERECPDAPARSPLKPVLGPEIHPSDGKHILSYRGRGLQWPLRQWCFSP